MRGQNITIRPETDADHDAIRHANQEAFDLTPSQMRSVDSGAREGGAKTVCETGRLRRSRWCAFRHRFIPSW